MTELTRKPTLPNLFQFATSEASQDAVLCWLLSWAKPEYGHLEPLLHRTALDFIERIFHLHSVSMPKVISRVEVTRQDNYIDVLCVLNDEYVILIEDKTHTEDHSNQLVNYLNEVSGRGYERDKVLPVYYKTEDQGCYRRVVKKGYQPFTRPMMLQVLNRYPGDNAIVLDYRAYLTHIQQRSDSYITEPVERWSQRAWKGYFLYLQRELGVGTWRYVPNKNGGFMGFWWHFVGDDDCEQYLQIEEKKLCVKIGVAEASQQKALRQLWYENVKERAKTLAPAQWSKPPRFGTGACMTVFQFKGDFRVVNDDGRIDLESTLVRLRQSQRLLTST